MNQIHPFRWPQRHPAPLSEQEWNEVAGSLSLTPTEATVCKHLFDCITRSQIAARVDAKPRTIRHHLEQIHMKLRVNNRIGVVLRIIQVRDWLRSKDSAQTSDAELGA